MNWYLSVLQNYAEFGGRARRKEYWFFALFSFLIACGLALIEGLAVLFRGDTHVSVLGDLYDLAMLIPTIAVGVRRLHDTGRSGWWLMIALVPILGAIVLVVWLAQDSQPGENRFGPNPKTASA